MVTAHGPQACYLIEWYRPDLGDDEIDDALAQLSAGCAARCDQGGPVGVVMALAVPTDEVLYGLFIADSPADVTASCRAAGIPVGRITRAVLAASQHDPDGNPR
jgi:hypothetical protein